MTLHSKIKSGTPVELSRRGFLVGTTAAGVTFGFASSAALAATAPASISPSIWYSIGNDGLVTVNVGKADMGQHVASTMAQIVAEELGAAWSGMRVNLIGNDPRFADPVLGALITGGSWSTKMNFDAMSRAGAAGRMALVEAAAVMMGVPAGELTARNSVVSHVKSRKSATFAEIVKSGKVTKTFSADELKAIKLKTASEYTMIGKDLPQLDIPSKTNGSAKYGIDTFLPGMVYGKLVLPPVRYGAKVTAVDDSAAKKLPGFIKAVVLEDKTGTTTGWVVAVAQTYWQATKAAEALKVTWDNGPNAKVSSESLMAEAKRLSATAGTDGLLFVKSGDTTAAFAGAAKTLEGEYTTQINIHAPLEPMNCTAEIKDGILHLYTGNQFATRSTAIAAGATGMDPKNVVMHQFYIGGGFGRRLDSDMLVPAALAAQAVGKPVKVIYSRADDMTMDFSRPLTLQKVKAGLDANGKLIAMEHAVVSAWPTKRWGIPAFLGESVDKKGPVDGFALNGSDHFYSVPNHTVRAVLNEMAQNATPSGQLRSVAPGWTFWAVESMIDELAHAAGKDPAEFRLAMLDGTGTNAGALRLKNTLLAAMGLSGYGTKVLPKGEALGVACISGQEHNSTTWTACVAHVAVAANGEVTVKRLTVATDVGTAINPDGVRAQIMGAASWGMSLAMFEKATMKDGGIEQTNFDTYTPMRMAQAPVIDISIIANGEAPSGCGEPAVTVVAPAIGNAIFNACGARVRALPITAEAVKANMKA